MRASPLTGGGCSDVGPLAPSFSISPFPGPAYVGRGAGGKGDPQQRGQACGVGARGKRDPQHRGLKLARSGALPSGGSSRPRAQALPPPCLCVRADLSTHLSRGPEAAR